MSRDIEYQPKLKCDNCGEPGAFDFMGDYYCSECLVTNDDDIVIGVDHDRKLIKREE